MSELVVWTIIFHVAWLIGLLVWWQGRAAKRRPRVGRASRVYAAQLDDLEKHGPVP